jgi:SAM-dependent methyltransferase
MGTPMVERHRLRRTWYEFISNFPSPIRENLRRASVTSLGFLESMTFRRNGLVPPLKVRIQSGTGNWFRIGKEFLDVFVALAALEPRDRVLEVGCGLGRIALAIGSYLGPDGIYEGFDIDPGAVEWCRTRITPRYPNLRFRLVDVRNTAYNPTGSTEASEFIFPYPAGTFDLVCLTSVFTHMTPREVGQYLREIRRVMRVGARCVITYFLLDEESIGLMEAGRGEYRFAHDQGIYRVLDRAQPELAVAYDASFVRRLYDQIGLKIIEPVHWGSWSGRKDSLSVQDIVIAENPS